MTKPCRLSRLLALIAVAALVAAGCGAGSPPGLSARGPGSTEPDTTSCGIALCDSTPSTSAPSTDATTTPWVAATGNLAGLPSDCGNVTLLSATPDRDLVIAGVSRQGLWASVNGSSTWTRIGQGSGSTAVANQPSSITFDPSNTNRFWESGIYGTGLGSGLYETVDNGTTFRQIGTLIHSDFVSVDFNDPARRTLLSGRHESSNLYRSADGGVTWVDQSAALPAGIGYTTAPLVVNAQVHLLGTKAAPGSGVFRTTDGGTTWTRIHQGGVSGPALVAKTDGAIYWILEQGGGLIKSVDQGVTWQKVLGPGRISVSAATLVELPDGRLATFGTHVIVSADHGATWQPVGPPLPYMPSGLVYAATRKAFYVWRSDCNLSGGTSSVKADAIMRLNFDYKTR